MTKKAIDIIGNNAFYFVLDKGHYTAEQIHRAQKMGIITLICIPNPAANAPNKAYNLSESKYNKKLDYYTCPACEILKSNGNCITKEYIE